MRSNNPSSLCWRRYLGDICGYCTVDEANPQAIEESTDQEHRYVHRACLYRRRYNTHYGDDLDRSLSAQEVQKPEDGPASNAACSSIKPIARTDDTAAIATGSFKIEVGVERWKTYDRAYDGRIEAVREGSQSDKEGNRKVVSVGFDTDVTHLDKYGK